MERKLAVVPKILTQSRSEMQKGPILIKYIVMSLPEEQNGGKLGRP